MLRLNRNSRDYIFVYGTLLSHFKSPIERRLCRQAKFIDQGYINGKLYDLGNYPGFIPSNDSNEKVFGEIYQFSCYAPLLDHLDVYEGYDANGLEKSLFQRIRLSAEQKTGDKLSVWSYAFLGQVSDKCRIWNGNYAMYTRAQPMDTTRV